MNQRRDEQSETPQNQQTGSAGPEQELLALVHEQAEALQAITNYLQVAARMAEKISGDAVQPLRDVLEKTANQVSRANHASHKLHVELSQSQKSSRP